jgi:DNA-binding response OmpR family regulator
MRCADVGPVSIDVLVVDDDPDVRAMLLFTLRSHGFDVREADDGEPALEQLETRPPDAMLLDLMMPFDGYAVLEAMRDRGLGRDVCVVVLSAKGDERDLVHAWQLGADEYLTKPVDPDHLADKIRELVDSRAASPAS